MSRPLPECFCYVIFLEYLNLNYLTKQEGRPAVGRGVKSELLLRLTVLHVAVGVVREHLAHDLSLVFAVNTLGDLGQAAPGMPAYSRMLSDAEIAAVLTYARNAWGRAAPAISASDVAAARKDLHARND